jgi:predicted nucleic acid-binding Zn ribbon protein
VSSRESGLTGPRHAGRAAPRTLGAAISELAERLAPTTPLARVQWCWAELAVALPVAAEGRPSAMRDGVLTVRCGASVYAQELQLMSGELVAAINGSLGEEAVRELRVRSC